MRDRRRAVEEAFLEAKVEELVGTFVRLEEEREADVLGT